VAERRNQAGGRLVSWRRFRRSSAFLTSSNVPDWTVVGIGDLNADGKMDLAWQHDVTRQAVVWYMGGAQGITPLSWNWLATSGVAEWSFVGTSDLNRDGKVDLIWQHDWSRQVVVWYLGGAQGTQSLGWNWLSSAGVPGWKVIARWRRPRLDRLRLKTGFRYS
jgi:hypothetical protein